MFRLPEAKRVRREELYSPSISPRSSPDPELDQLFRNHIEHEFHTIVAPEETPKISQINEEDVSGEEELEFRLFVPCSNVNKPGVSRIRVKSPAADNRPPGLVNPQRARSHYFRDSLSPEAEEQLRFAAVSGADILARSKISCPGCSLPWRVTTISVAGVAIPSTAIVAVEQTKTSSKSKKKRKGKKSRIAIRQKTAKEHELLEKARISAAEKELTEKMKKAKRNREKKFKKRARDKARKMARDDLENDQKLTENAEALGQQRSDVSESGADRTEQHMQTPNL